MDIDKLNINKSIIFALAFSLAAPVSVAFAAEGRGTLNLLDTSVKFSDITVGNLTFGDIVRPVSGSNGWLSMTCPSGSASVVFGGGVENPDTNDDECGVVTVTASENNQRIVITLEPPTAFTNGSHSLPTFFSLELSPDSFISLTDTSNRSRSVTRTFANTSPVNFYMGADVRGISSDDPLGVYTAIYEVTIADAD